MKLSDPAKVVVAFVFGLAVQWAIALAIDDFGFSRDITVFPSASLGIVVISAAMILRFGDRPKKQMESGAAVLSYRQRQRQNQGCLFVPLALLVSLLESAGMLLIFMHNFR